ncbi:MAG: pilin [Candidatus Peregrinibacteria bacterium]|nr:pilin [Candidatus Peregrinibacteria bacterium]
MKKFSKIIKTITTTSILLGLMLMNFASTQAAISIDDELHPEYAPEGYSEVYNPDGTAEEQFGVTSINYIIADIAVVLLQISGALAIFFIIMNGFNYIKAFGQEEEIQKAKKGLTWAIVGLLVVILSYAIVQNVLRITLSVDDNDESGAVPSETNAHFLGMNFIDDKTVLI